MSSVPSFTSPSKPETERQKVKSSRRKRIVRILVIGLIIIAVVVAWQALNAYNNSSDPTVAGRPLSNPHTYVRAYEVETVTAAGQHRCVVAIDINATQP